MPVNMTTGDQLKSSSFKAKTAAGTKITIDVADRRVVDQEKLNSSAGAFNCLVIQQNVNSKAKKKLKIQTKEWYAVGTGMVKSESYKKGKLTGYTILTSFNQ